MILFLPPAVCVPADYCQNGGTCAVHRRDEFVCRCTEGYTGDTCNEGEPKCNYILKFDEMNCYKACWLSGF